MAVCYIVNNCSTLHTLRPPSAFQIQVIATLTFNHEVYHLCHSIDVVGSAWLDWILQLCRTRFTSCLDTSLFAVVLIFPVPHIPMLCVIAEVCLTAPSKAVEYTVHHYLEMVPEAGM